MSRGGGVFLLSRKTIKRCKTLLGTETFLLGIEFEEQFFSVYLICGSQITTNGKVTHT